MVNDSSGRLVDSHVHLDRYSDEAVSRMVARAKSVGVGTLLTIGVDRATSEAALRLAARHPELLAAVGIHPTRVGPSSWLRDLLAHRPATIGEVGLDQHAPDLDGQRAMLDGCLALAQEHGLPVVLHVVGAPPIHEAALQIVARYPTMRTVAHYFVSGPEIARRYLDHGCWISVGRPVTRPAESAVREAVMMIPLDRLLLETDTYPLPGRTTEPRDVTTVCGAVAELTGRSYAEIASATTANFWRFIGPKERDARG